MVSIIKMNKIIVSLIIVLTTLGFSQNTTILFLRDGSIIQGTITHEKPNKIFLKTDMGFIQIKPEDIIGREDLAKKGDLTYMSDQIEFVRRYVESLSGKTVSWKDSLNSNIENLYQIYKGVEILQQEFEADLLRLHTKEQEKTKQLLEITHDIVEHEVDISLNRQNIGLVGDTISNINNGFITIKNKEFYKYEVNIYDANGNKSKLVVPILGVKTNKPLKLVNNHVELTYIERDKKYELEFNSVRVSILEETFYNNLLLEAKFENDILSIDKDTIPLLKPITIYFNTDRYNDSIKNQLYIAKLSDNKKMTSYNYTTDFSNGKKSSTKSLGRYTLGVDTINPAISPIGFKENDWISNFSNLKIKVNDVGSGIRSYNGWINNKWILFELNTKKGILVYDFDDNIVRKAKNNLHIEIIDNVGNRTEYKTTFYRKSN